MHHEGNRQLQQRFGSPTWRTDCSSHTSTEFSDYDKNFIESSPFFFSATADAEGRPDCHLKADNPDLSKWLDCSS